MLGAFVTFVSRLAFSVDFLCLCHFLTPTPRNPSCKSKMEEMIAWRRRCRWSFKPQSVPCRIHSALSLSYLSLVYATMHEYDSSPRFSLTETETET